MTNPAQTPLYVSLEFTPNPNTLKYSVNRTLLERGAVNVLNAADAQARSPLAVKLLAIPGIMAVMIGRDFVTVTKSEAGDWDQVHKGASSTIEEHLNAGLSVVNEAALNAQAHGGGDTNIEDRIRTILDNEIRPAVAMDGGDITFEKFEAGIVYLYLQGSCAGCPSSTATLKQGIETRLKQEIPEIIEVVSV